MSALAGEGQKVLVVTLGQILPGVPVWRLSAGAWWPGMTYVVFPGNVGDDTALFKAVKTLSGG